MPLDAPVYPGAVLHRPTPPATLVRLVQRRLNQLGCGPVEETGRFDLATMVAVKRFQVRSVDERGDPLDVDGILGPITWASLFGASETAPVSPPVSAPVGASLAIDALAIAVGEIGTLEVPLGSNRGPRVDQYVAAVGLDPAGKYPWCAAFVYWCFGAAALRAAKANPVVKTAGVLPHWRGAAKRGIPCLLVDEAVRAPEKIRPGFVFAMDYGRGVGHTGFVERVEGGTLVTIEGNTNAGGSREGIGVFRRTARKIGTATLGFIDYTQF